MIWLGKVSITGWLLAIPGMCWCIPRWGDGARLEMSDLLGVRWVWGKLSGSGSCTSEANDTGGHCQSVSSGISNVN